MFGTDRDEHQEDVRMSHDQEALPSPRFLSVEDRTYIQLYVLYLFYRVQLDLYEIGKETGLLDHISWDDFVFAVRGHQRTRQKAYDVANEAITEATARGDFNFDSTLAELPFDDDTMGNDGDMIPCAQLFSFEDGAVLIDLLLVGIEIAQYFRQLYKGKDYDWEEFIIELEKGETMWEEVLVALRDTMAKLDFKPYWPVDALDDLIMGNEAN